MSNTRFPSSSNAIRLIAAPFTPLNPNGTLNLGQVAFYAARLHAQGVAGVFICGTTGEGISLSQAERRQVAEAWRAATSGRMELIVHVGHGSPDESCDLARHAQEIGADGIAAIGPVFFTPSSRQALVALSRKIANAAPETDFYYYHMPSMSRVPFTASSVIEEMSRLIPTFRGVKFTHDDLVDYKRCIELADGKYEVFFGRDELLLKGIIAGAVSAVGSTYNFAAPLYHRVAQAWRSGDEVEAKRVQTLATDGINCMIRHGGLPAIKATLALSGIECGPMRLPLEMPSRESILKLEQELDALGYFTAIRSSSESLVS